MKVLWFVNILLPDLATALGLPVPPGGGWLVSLLNVLKQQYKDLQFYVVTEYDRKLNITVKEVTYMTIPRPRRAGLWGMMSPEVVDETAKCVRDVLPDVIHIHGTENFYARLPKSVFHGIPVLVSLQGIINGYYQHYVGGLSPNEISRYVPRLQSLFNRGDVFRGQEHWRAERSRQEKIALEQHDCYAGRTDWDRSWVKFFNPEATYYHLDEVLRSEFYGLSQTREQVEPYRIYCSAATTYPLKGAHWLFRAVASLRKRYPRIQVRIANAQRVMTVPSGVWTKFRDSQYGRYLRDLATQLNIKDNLVALPSLSADEVVDELKRAHVFVLPSLCENSPNSLGEAMLVGTPAVATYVGGVPSMIQHEENGLLCPSCDPASLADAIARLFDCDKLCGKLSINAMKVACERHEPTRIARETRAIYTKMVAGHKTLDEGVRGGDEG